MKNYLDKIFPQEFPRRLFFRITLAQIFVILFALTICGIAARYFFKSQFVSQEGLQLKNLLVGLSNSSLANNPTAFCEAFKNNSGIRITVIDGTGLVWCDSHHDSRSMENHSEREEVKAAWQFGYGQEIRQSSTIGEVMIYGALRMPDAKFILRGAVPLHVLNVSLKILDRSISIFLLLISCALILYTLWTGHALALPISRVVRKARAAGANSRPEVMSRDDELTEIEESLDELSKKVKGTDEKLTRERTEQQILMSSISEAILAIDLEGRPLFYNSKLTLLARRDQLKNMRLWEIFRNNSINQAFTDALQQSKPIILNALPLEISGTKRYFSLSVTPLSRGNAETYGALGIFHDVTELKRAEQIRIDFVANVSHEIRTPLTAIKGFTDTIIDDLKSNQPVDSSHVEIINKNTNRLMNLINDLLDLSSIESNSNELQLDSVSTENVTERVIQVLKKTIEGRGQIITSSYKVPFVWADARRLEQVLINLIDNASKYSPKHGKIHVEWTENQHSQIVLSVSDTGPGIPQEDIPRLFERFYRVDKARSREIGGTGLGLAIVKHIMLAHGGSVEVESSLGEGSLFRCHFKKME